MPPSSSPNSIALTSAEREALAERPSTREELAAVVGAKAADAVIAHFAANP